ncbi:uncharacterized protein [Blastocystis hominis]|uniref:Uncharacterized protein n=1 Tax=Blastocystis hominis TaxID=12968 RepID=D8M7U3_BLAHO|nr:uncharacterized protein [Blastocystis hominis]CBK24132.2 unnamed protein product [Blastocystis hominis]|eukprot:XP_012898180.1 uncharacterized protein [Blastocystis hominis]
MTYFSYICIFTIICCIITTGSAASLYTENAVNEENYNSAVDHTSIENSDFSKFYVRDKLRSLNLANLDLSDSSANNKISRSKENSLHGLNNENTAKEVNEYTDLSIPSIALSRDTERKLQDHKAHSKVVKHSVILPLVEAYYPKTKAEAEEGSAKLSSTDVSSNGPKDITTDGVANTNVTFTTKLHNDTENKEAVEQKEEKKEAVEENEEKKEAIEENEEKKEAVEENEEKKEVVEDNEEKKEAVEENEEKKEAVEENEEKKEAVEDNEEKKEAVEENEEKKEVVEDKEEKKEAVEENEEKKEAVEDNEEKKEAVEENEEKKEAVEENEEKKEAVEENEEKKEAVEENEEKKEAVEENEEKKEAVEENEEKKEAVEENEEKKEAVEENEEKKEAVEENEEKKEAVEDKEEKKEAVEENEEKKEAVEENEEKKEAVEDKEEKKEAVEDKEEKKEAVEENEEKKEAVEENEEKKEAVEDKEEKKEAVEENEEKKEVVEDNEEKKDSQVMEQITSTNKSQKRRKIHKRKSSQINQMVVSPTTQDMNQSSTKEPNTNKDSLYIDNLKLDNINNIALINTSSPQSTEVHPSSTALPVMPDAVLLSNKDKEQHKQIEAIVSKSNSVPESIAKDAVDPGKPDEMSSPSMNSDLSHRSRDPVHHPEYPYDRPYHLRSSEGYRGRLRFNAKIIRKNIIEVQISSHQDVSCYIIGRSGQRSPKTTIYSTKGRTRHIHLSSWFTPYQVECGDNDVCTVTERGLMSRWMA